MALRFHIFKSPKKKPAFQVSENSMKHLGKIIITSKNLISMLTFSKLLVMESIFAIHGVIDLVFHFFYFKKKIEINFLLKKKVRYN